MDEYKQPYFILWQGITNAIEMIEQQNFGMAKELLIKSQQDAEEAYINSGSI